MSNKRFFKILITTFLIVLVCELALIFFLKYRQDFKDKVRANSSGETTEVTVPDTSASTVASLKEENAQLQFRVAELQNQVDQLQGKIPYPDDTYNYLAIGNSLTKHSITSFWWTECGMAATTADRDYVHVVANGLRERKGEVYFTAVSFGQWEYLDKDRAVTYDMLNPYLSDKLNLITVQLTDNVLNLDSLEADYADLIRYIHENAPNAQIILIGSFWDHGTKDAVIYNTAVNNGLEYVSLDEIKDNPAYQAGMGTIVYDEAGNGHDIQHPAVAAHPNDIGMQYIADRILERVY